MGLIRDCLCGSSPGKNHNGILLCTGFFFLLTPVGDGSRISSNNELQCIWIERGTSRLKESEHSRFENPDGQPVQSFCTFPMPAICYMDKLFEKCVTDVTSLIPIVDKGEAIKHHAAL